MKPERRFLRFDSRPAGAARRPVAVAFKFAAGQMPRRYGSARPHTATQGRPLLVMLMPTIVSPTLGTVLALHDDALSEDERKNSPV